eukprot:TRINITY_DN2923_c0_g1_i1.p1 TRINITY_DN2923_c0_g1~~TRINITY_DN2923_c0_g1_i1.p1  ORF type:complete len:204 (-),score=55.16 TRINITY_DN2923_c0_g1_i1:77-664(-)
MLGQQTSGAGMLTLRCKVLVVGAAGVGKSSLTQQFHSDGKVFPKNYVMTIGAEFCVKSVGIPDRNNVAVELYMLDIAGSDMYKTMAKEFMENPGMVMLVYDVTKKESLQALTAWLDVVKSFFPREVVQGVVVANKMDQEARAQVSRQDGKAFAKAHNLEFFCTSAKETKDIDAPFNFIANSWYKLYEETVKNFVK